MNAPLNLSFGKKLLFSLIPLFVVLIILEVVGRIIYPFDLDSRAELKVDRDPRKQLSYVSHQALHDIHARRSIFLPFLGWIGYPGNKLETIQNNNLGMRDRPLEARKPGEYRIVIIGGSSAWGFGASSNANTPAGVLERTLNESNSAKGRTYRVMNAAYPAWGSRQELILFIEFMDLLDPDMVIALTGFNDVNITTQGNTGQLRPEAGKIAQEVEASLRPSNTLPAIRKVFGTLGIWRLVVYFREVVAQKRNTIQKAQRTYKYNRAISNTAMRKISERYAIMAQISKRHYIKLLVALQPDMYSSKKIMTDEEREILNSHQERYVNYDKVFLHNRNRLKDALSHLQPYGLQLVDLANVFDGVSTPLFIDGAHLVDDGYRLIGERLAKVVTEVSM